MACDAAVEKVQLPVAHRKHVAAALCVVFYGEKREVVVGVAGCANCVTHPIFCFSFRYWHPQYLSCALEGACPHVASYPPL